MSEGRAAEMFSIGATSGRAPFTSFTDPVWGRFRGAIPFSPDTPVRRLLAGSTPVRSPASLAIFAASLAALSLPISAQAPLPRTGEVLFSTKIVHGQWGDQFGRSVDLLGDLNDDGIEDLVVGASHCDDGALDAGSIWILVMKADRTVHSAHKISATAGGFVGPLAEGDQFGKCVAGIGDLDGDGVEDVAVGAARAGDVWLLFLNADGTVKGETKIHNDDGDFGYSLAPVGDFDADGVTELAVGNGFGEVYLYFLQSDGVPKRSQLYRSNGGFYGIGMSTIGDFDGDGIVDLAVGNTDSTGFSRDEGYVHLSFMDASGFQKDSVTLKDGSPNLGLGLPAYPNWGRDIALLDDLDGNGVRDIAVGCSEDW